MNKKFCKQLSFQENFLTENSNAIPYTKNEEKKLNGIIEYEKV